MRSIFPKLGETNSNLVDSEAFTPDHEASINLLKLAKREPHERQIERTMNSDPEDRHGRQRATPHPTMPGTKHIFNICCKHGYGWALGSFRAEVRSNHWWMYNILVDVVLEDRMYSVPRVVPSPSDDNGTRQTPLKHMGSLYFDFS